MDHALALLIWANLSKCLLFGWSGVKRFFKAGTFMLKITLGLFWTLIEFGTQTQCLLLFVGIFTLQKLETSLLLSGLHLFSSNCRKFSESSPFLFKSHACPAFLKYRLSSPKTLELRNFFRPYKRDIISTIMTQFALV